LFRYHRGGILKTIKLHPVNLLSSGKLYRI
jgi:hypothetical protein